jgi:hypothetical protein
LISLLKCFAVNDPFPTVFIGRKIGEREVTIADRQEAFLTWDDFQLTPVIGDPEVIGPDPDRLKQAGQLNKDEWEDLHL